VGTYLPAGLPAPHVASGHPAAPYFDATRRSELAVQQCRDCGTFQWPPEYLCHACHSFDVGFTTVEPHAVIQSWERVWNPSTTLLATAVPYLVVCAELPHASGVRMIGNLLGDPRQDVQIGAAIEAVFEHHDDFTLVQWQVTR
jgi:uncharacterized OB-fold protein